MLELVVHVYEVYERHYLPADITKWYGQNYFHYIFVVKGEGELKISRPEYEHDFAICQGEIYLIPIGVRYQIKTKMECCLYTIEISFFLSNRFILKSLMSLPYKIKNTSAEIQSIIVDVLKESNRKDAFYEELLDIKLTQVILYILRINGNKKFRFK